MIVFFFMVHWSYTGAWCVACHQKDKLNWNSTPLCGTYLEYRSLGVAFLESMTNYRPDSLYPHYSALSNKLSSELDTDHLYDMVDWTVWEIVGRYSNVYCTVCNVYSVYCTVCNVYSGHCTVCIIVNSVTLYTVHRLSCQRTIIIIVIKFGSLDTKTKKRY